MPQATPSSFKPGIFGLAPTSWPRWTKRPGRRIAHSWCSRLPISRLAFRSPSGRRQGGGALSQPKAISGLGGIGKKQLAIEYAYRYRGEYQAVLWVRAETTEALNASYSELAALLGLPEKEVQEQEVVVQAVKGWLRQTNGWLLIL